MLADARGHVTAADFYADLHRGADAMREFDQALSVLQFRPMMATSRFGRGIAERRQANAKAAENDLAEARMADPDIGERFSEFGLSP